MQPLLQKGICHSLKTMGTCLEKGLSFLFVVFSFEGGRINWKIVRVIKLFSLIKPKSAEQGRILSQKPGNAQLILLVIIRRGRKKRKGIKRDKLG